MNTIYQVTEAELKNLIKESCEEVAEITAKKVLDSVAPKKYYTVKELSKLLSCHEVTVLKAIRSGQLEHGTIGGKKYIVSQTQLDTFLAR